MASPDRAASTSEWPARPGGRVYSSGYGTVLVVDRDEVGKPALEEAFLKEGLQILWGRSEHEAQQLLNAHRPGLIVLNPRLGPEDGWLVYRRLLLFEVPILVLAGDHPAVQRVALALGATDCLCGPVPAAEVAARARRLLGRSATAGAHSVSYGGITLDRSQGVVRLDGREANVTRTECTLLDALLQAQGRVVSRDQLVQRARAEAGALPLSRSIDAHVRALRRKLGDDPRQPRLIESVRGFGYRLAALPAAPAEGLLKAAFDVLPTACLVVDRQRAVHIVNRRAESLLGLSRGVAATQTCAELLGCDARLTKSGRCAGLEALSTRLPQSVRRHVGMPDGQLTIEEVAAALPDSDGYFVLELREVAE